MPRYFVWALRNECKKIEVEHADKLVFHSLRHYFITSMKSAGMPDYFLMKISGHKSEKMIQHYSDHKTEQDFEVASENILKVFGWKEP